MSAFPDRRQEKTRQAIGQAFLAMLFEQSYNAITIAAVAERANVGRSTFYEHFRTKSDLLKHSLETPFGALASIISENETPAFLLPLLQHFRDNHALGRVLFGGPTRAVLHRVLASHIEKHLPAHLPLPRTLLASQIASAQLALLEPWSLGQVAASAETMARTLHRTSTALARAVAETA